MRRRIVPVLLTLLMVIAMFSTTVLAAEFSDMPNDWSTAALEKAVENGLIVGDNGHIRAGDHLTRAQMAAIVNRAFGTTEMVAIDQFTDVEIGAWYYDDMAKAVQMKTFVGDGNKLYPENPITREEAFAVLARALKLTGASSDKLDVFSDKTSISEWALDEVASLASAGYVNGSNGRILAKDFITRAEFAQLMDNLVSHYITKAATYTENYSGNVMVNVPGVILKNLTITGDLIIGDGVGNGEVTLDGVTVTGRTLVRGGGENSVKLLNNSNLQNIIIARVDGVVRIYAEDGTEIGETTIDGSDNVTLEGNFGTITLLANDVTVTATNANIEAATIDGDNSQIIVGATSNIGTVTMNSNDATLEVMGAVTTVLSTETAQNSTIIASENATIESITANSESSVQGNGTVTNVTANAAVTVETQNTTVTVGENLSGILINGEEVAAGEAIVTPGELPPVIVPTTPIEEPEQIVYIHASMVPTGLTGIHNNKIYQEFQLKVGTTVIDLSATSVASIRVIKPGTIVAATLTPDTDSTLWFNVQNVTGEYSYLVTDRTGKNYEATLAWTAPLTVNAAATGLSGEHESIFYAEYSLGALNLSSFDAMYEIKADGSVVALTANTDTNLWFNVGSPLGSYSFLIKQGNVWSQAVIEQTPIAANLVTTNLTGIHNNKVYQEFQLKVGTTVIDLSAANITSLTVLKPGETTVTTLTPDTDSTLWFNVQNAAGNHVFTVVDTLGRTYTATLVWTVPAAVNAVATGLSGEHEGVFYAEYSLGALNLSSFDAMYEIKPDGSIVALTANTDTNLWFNVGSPLGSYTFLVKQGNVWSQAVIEQAPIAANLVTTNLTGIHSNKVYQEFQLKVGTTVIDLSAANVASLTVLKPGETTATTLTPDTDSTLWFNVQNAAGNHVFTVVDTLGRTYTATLVWTVPAVVNAAATGLSGEHEGVFYAEYSLGALNLSSFDAMYEIKADGSVVALTANTDTNLWFNVGSPLGSYTFLVKQGNVWSQAVIEQTPIAANLVTTNLTGIHNNKVYQEFQLKVGTTVIDLSAANITSLTVLKPGETTVTTLTPDTDSTLWFNVQNAAGNHVFTVVDTLGRTYTATLAWTAPLTVNAAATGLSGEHESIFYAEYSLGALNLSSFDAMYEIKADGSVVALTANTDTNLWFNVGSPLGSYSFLVKQGNVWSQAVIEQTPIAANLVTTNLTGIHNNKVYQEFQLKVGTTVIDLSAANITSLTVLKPGETTVTTLTPDTDSTLWFNVQNAAGNHVFTVVDTLGRTYTATLVWTVPAAVNAVATGLSGEHEGVFYAEYSLGALNLSSFDAMYEIKPDGSIVALTANTDTNLWFNVGSPLGSYTFLVKQGNVWSQAVIEQAPIAANLVTTNLTGIHSNKVYQEFQLKVGTTVIDLSAANVASLTVLKPGETTATTLIPDTDSTLWFNVQNAAGNHVFTVVDNYGKTYEATLVWTAPVMVTVEETGRSGEHEGILYAECTLGTLDLSSFDAMYEIKPDGSVVALTANTDTNLWFNQSSPVGVYIFLVKQGSVWSEAVIDLNN